MRVTPASSPAIMPSPAPGLCTFQVAAVLLYQCCVPTTVVESAGKAVPEVSAPKITTTDVPGEAKPMASLTAVWLAAILKPCCPELNVTSVGVAVQSALAPAQMQ